MIGKLKAIARNQTWLYLAHRHWSMRLRRLRSGHKHVHPTFFSKDLKHVSRDLVAHEYAFVGRGCEICPKVELGAYVMLGPCVLIVGDDHRFDEPGVPMIFSGRPEKRKTTLERDVWIGAGAIIMSGVTIGRGSIVAAGSIVTKDIPPYEIHAGVPAKKLRDRFNTEQEKQAHDAMLDAPPQRGDFCEPVQTQA